MEQAFAELPLAIFSTLAPIAAGSFIALAIASLTVSFSDEQKKKLDKMSWLPLVVLVVAFIAAFFHLTQPMNAINVFNGLGRSPMSNELLAGVIFAVLAIIYCIIAATGKLSDGSRKGLTVVLAIVGLVFTILMGTAYSVPTVLSWDTPLIPLMVVGFSLLGGGLLGTLMVAMAGGLGDARKSSFKMGMLVVVVVGAVLSIGCLAAQYVTVGGITTASTIGADITAGLMMYLAITIICMVVAVICECMALVKSDSVALPGIGLVLMIVGVLIARLMFYAMQISVGF